MQIRVNRLFRQAKPLEIKETLRILIPPCGGSNPPTPATQSGLRGLAPLCIESFDISVGWAFMGESQARHL